MNIICLGTSPTLARTMTFDRLSVDDVNRAANVYDYAAGKAVNAARAIHTLGEQSICLGVAGGSRGDMLRGLLDRAGLTHELIEAGTQTRLCVTAVDRAASTATELVEENPRLTRDIGQKLIDALANHVARSRVVVLAGSMNVDDFDNFYARCVDVAHAANAICVLDASGKALAHALALKPDVIKINRKELAGVVDFSIADDSGFDHAMSVVGDRIGVGLIVTDGPGAVRVRSAGTTWRVTPPQVKAVSAIGSGDCFTGSLAWSIARACAATTTHDQLKGSVDTQHGSSTNAADDTSRRRPAIAGEAFVDFARHAVAVATANALTSHAAHFEVADVGKLLGSVRVHRG